MNPFQKIKSAVNKYQRFFINRTLQRKLTNQGMTVISANCMGAFILHDLHQPFNSPFVNLYLSPQDFLRYLQNMDFYRTQPLTFVQTEKSYPVGKLADLDIHFMHYHSEQEANEKWQLRTSRMKLDNLFIMMTDRDGVTEKDIQLFDQLPFKNKVIFTHKPYPAFKSAYYIKGFEKQNQVGDIFEFSGWNGKKILRSIRLREVV
ncbi:exopolysaccharide biosynthesis protein [Haemophilus influenzae]|uniref:Exopolysaccharide biosynthesis protein n=1 Tax=Haemophilus influenzae TaxID=727 RepID=A0A2X1PTV9_HAEIF|nr:exopolysaccharide biosynthesis protein [Haemophilus influenzae]